MDKFGDRLERLAIQHAQVWRDHIMSQDAYVALFVERDTRIIGRELDAVAFNGDADAFARGPLAQMLGGVRAAALVLLIDMGPVVQADSVPELRELTAQYERGELPRRSAIRLEFSDGTEFRAWYGVPTGDFVTWEHNPNLITARTSGGSPNMLLTAFRHRP